MNSIDVVAPRDIRDDLNHISARLRFARVDPELFPGTSHPLRMCLRDVVRRQILARAHRCAKRIDPGMQLEPARMCFLDGKGQRIIPWRPACRAAEEFRPWLLRRSVERVA